MNKEFYVLLLIFACLTVSCAEKKEEQQEKKRPKPIVCVYDKCLYPSDLELINRKSISPSDSATKVSNYIDFWIKNQLLLKKAEMNLTAEQKNVSRELDDYRASLLIYKYKKKFIEQKLDTSITQEEIRQYYRNNAREFILSNNVIKALYIKVPLDAPKQYQIKWQALSKREKDSLALFEYCRKFAVKYDYFGEKWIHFNDLLKELPIEVSDQENYIKYNPFMQAKDSLFNYYVAIKDYRLKTDITPFQFVKTNIKSILLNKKKLNLLMELEKNIYNDALNQRLIHYKNNE